MEYRCIKECVDYKIGDIVNVTYTKYVQNFEDKKYNMNNIYYIVDGKYIFTEEIFNTFFGSYQKNILNMIKKLLN
jgi:hypothetical protein